MGNLGRFACCACSVLVFSSCAPIGTHIRRVLVSREVRAVIAWIIEILRMVNDAMNGFLVLLLLSLTLAGMPGQAGAQFVSPEKEKVLRSLIPDEQIANEPRLILYTEREMPRAYQFAGPGQYLAGVHDAYHNISGDADEAAKGHGRGGNGNVEFPWREPGGTDKTAGVNSFKGIVLPEGKPIVWFTNDVGPHCDNNLNVTRVYDWRFPVGTKIFEVLTWKIGRHDYPFEMRIRERLADKWAVDILRPFPTAESLLAALDAMPEADETPIVRHLRSNPQGLPVRTLADTNHRSSMAINVRAAVDTLPEIPDDLVVKLLSKRPFESALGVHWRGDSYAPSGGITPVGYDGTFLGTDQTSCKRCHESALQHVDEFDAPRNWYGRIRGCSDQILSFHPFEPSCISGNGGHVPARIRNIPVVIERYDASRHAKADYTELAP